MKLPLIPAPPRIKFRLNLPQRLAGLLLLVFLAECLWVIGHQQTTSADYRYARCGREMWERPLPLAGYFTTCGNLNGDGTFAYRVAGLPLTVQRLVLLGTDKLRKPENRLYVNGSLNGSTWEARHELTSVRYLLHLPFVFFALWLGAGLWWVARRLFGNEGGFLALGLYCFCPAIVRYAVAPNNEMLAMWGLYGVVYTGMGVAHAMAGPRRRWRPRILLLTLALGLTAAAHTLAAILGFVVSFFFMFYLAERKRSAVMQILVNAGVGSLVILFAFYAFRLQPFSYVFTGGGARMWFSLEPALGFAKDLLNGPILVAAAVSLLVYLAAKRSRYFGNTAPLLMVLLLAPIVTTQNVTQPWLWALPFLFTFIGGVFADVLETKHRKLFLALTGMILVAQASVCVATLSLLAR
ncbi:hypothetical protein SAMN05421770_101317 [Granulicella rosea]|uniref:Glycosyltransferase RgtA/B/C/D-like domain-containing protein n=1 Tax=Granulicella rosea TaxID=474952 RepID=A0A239D610_9BACT|nr:hypothetical protein [Granulicella rosea]SNS27946.1 hypothetical protein SAMN05421770_101317 [Granulicella rosea]